MDVRFGAHFSQADSFAVVPESTAEPSAWETERGKGFHDHQCNRRLQPRCNMLLRRQLASRYLPGERRASARWCFSEIRDLPISSQLIKKIENGTRSGNHSSEQ
jgi:hypothetical protein